MAPKRVGKVCRMKCGYGCRKVSLAGYVPGVTIVHILQLFLLYFCASVSVKRVYFAQIQLLSSCAKLQANWLSDMQSIQLSGASSTSESSPGVLPLDLAGNFAPRAPERQFVFPPLVFGWLRVMSLI